MGKSLITARSNVITYSTAKNLGVQLYFTLDVRIMCPRYTTLFTPVSPQFHPRLHLNLTSFDLHDWSYFHRVKRTWGQPGLSYINTRTRMIQLLGKKVGHHSVKFQKKIDPGSLTQPFLESSRKITKQHKTSNE